MESEALGKVRTMRQVKSSLDLTRGCKAKTTNSLFRMPEKNEQANPVIDSRTLQILSKEKRRFSCYERSVMKSRDRLLKSREKLALTINRNRALTDLRHDLQSERWAKKETPGELPDPPSILNAGFRQVEISY